MASLKLDDSIEISKFVRNFFLFVPEQITIK